MLTVSYQTDLMARGFQAGGRLLVANVGDSRAFLGRVEACGRATAVPLTSDHTPDVPAEAARILAHQAGAFFFFLLCLLVVPAWPSTAPCATNISSL